MSPEQRVRFLQLSSSGSISDTIDALVKLFILYNTEEELSPTTISTRKTHLSQFARFCAEVGVDDIQLLNNHFIDQYFVNYRETHGKATTNTGKKIMKVFLMWVRDYKEITLRIHPELIKSVKVRNKIPQAIDRATIAHVIKKCPILQDKLIIATFAESGVRISELIKIRVSDVRGDTLAIQGKGQIDRIVVITDRLADELQEFISDMRRTPDEYLFQNIRSSYGQQLSKDTVWRHVKRWFRDLADLEMHPHQLRHSFAMNLLENGCDIVTIKELLGHEDINTTMIYLRTTNNFRSQNYKLHIGKSLMA